MKKSNLHLRIFSKGIETKLVKDFTEYLSMYIKGLKTETVNYETVPQQGEIVIAHRHTELHREKDEKEKIELLLDYGTIVFCLGGSGRTISKRIEGFIHRGTTEFEVYIPLDKRTVLQTRQSYPAHEIIKKYLENKVQD
jgi:hypothetical protein